MKKNIFLWLIVTILGACFVFPSSHADERDGEIESPHSHFFLFDHPVNDVCEALNLMNDPSFRTGHSPNILLTAPDVSQIPLGYEPEGDLPEEIAITPDGTKVLITNRDSDNVSIYSMVDLSHITTIPVGEFPEDIKITPDGQLALVANALSHSVTVIDVPGNSVITEIPTGGIFNGQPVEIEIARDTSLAFVAHVGTRILSVIDLNRLEVVQEIQNIPIILFGGGFIPENGNAYFLYTEFRVTPDGSKVVYPDRFNRVVFIIDVVTESFTDTIGVVDMPNAIELSQDGSTAFVAIETSGNGRIMLIDISTATITKNIPVGESIHSRHIGVTPDGSTVLIGILNNIVIVDVDSSKVDTTLYTGGVFDVDVTPDGAYGFVTNYYAKIIDIAGRSIAKTLSRRFVNTAALSPTERKAAALVNIRKEEIVLYNIDGSSGSILETVPAGLLPEIDAPRTIAITPDGDIAVTGNILSENATCIDLNTHTIVSTFPIGERTGGVDITSDGAYAVVTSIEHARVKIIDLSIPEVVATVFTRANPVDVSILPGDTLALVEAHGNSGGNGYVTVVRLDGSSSSWVKDISLVDIRSLSISYSTLL
jgi:YVTN family beta-propeller protein